MKGPTLNLYYRWSREFLEADKKRVAGDTAREVTSDEARGQRAEAQQLKELLAEMPLENDRRWGVRFMMRYRAAEKLEIIRLVEHRRCRYAGLWHNSVSRAPFYRWYQPLFGARRRGPGRWPVGARPRLE
jgi:putative transposase